MYQQRKTMEPFPMGSRVVLIGDSITCEADYAKYIVAYYKKNFLERAVTFSDAGIAGGSLTSALLSYDSLIAPFAPTHATIMLGVNDSDRDALRVEDMAVRQERLDAAFAQYACRMYELLDRLEKDGVKVTLFTPPPYAEFMVSEENPIPGCYALIQKYADYVRQTARERGLALVDIHAYLSERYLEEEIYRGDHVHPNMLGQYRLAECILAAQGLTIAPYANREEFETIEPEIGKWRTLAEVVANLYTLEWLTMHAFDRPVEEQIKTIRDMRDTGMWDNSPYLLYLVDNYFANKQKQAEISVQLQEVWQEIYPDIYTSLT